ncbi:anaphase-promoting complex, cyclosome, subunit 4-domain-containing protein, partial [Parasitella parasitica]
MPEVELFATLATGNVTESLQEFFTEYLSSQRIKQWETNVKHGHHNSLVIICEHILPACERIQLQLSKLLGYSLWTQRYGDFLRTNEVEKCITKARHLVFETFQYSKSLGDLIKSFDAFSKWIAIVSQKVYDPESVEIEQQSGLCEEPELVASFLDKDFV